MWSSTACKALAIAMAIPAAGLPGPSPDRAVGSPSWSASLVTEPRFIGAAFHPTLQGSAKMDLDREFRMQTRLSLSREAYGLFEPIRDPRAWDVSLSLLGGAVLPVWLGWLEASVGVGTRFGRNQGELHYQHVWSGGLFAERTREYRAREYVDLVIPYQVQWLFGRDQEGMGIEYSGYLSRDAGRWGIGVFWQYYLGPAPPSKPARGARPLPPPTPEPAGEELEETEGGEMEALEPGPEAPGREQP